MPARLRITYQSIISHSTLIVFFLTLITIAAVAGYLYARLYKPITQAETIIIIRSETALLPLDFAAYEKLKDTQAARHNLAPLLVPTTLNPFISR